MYCDRQGGKVDPGGAENPGSAFSPLKKRMKTKLKRIHSIICFLFVTEHFEFLLLFYHLVLVKLFFEFGFSFFHAFGLVKDHCK
jgi:hypothetical protein